MTILPAPEIDHLRGWIGKQAIAEDTVSAELAHRFHATFDLPGDMPQPGQAVAPLIHFCLAQPVVPTSELDSDGHPRRGGFLPPVPLPRRMWAGGDVRFHDVLRVGEVVRRVSTIKDVTAKAGRNGQLCFVAVDHRIEVDGKLRIEERQDIVYRDPVDKNIAHAEQGVQAEIGQYCRSIEASPPFLFRYSALTFNSHRIHYDRRYAQEVEFYRGLVVHGPLQATLLMNLAMELRGRQPSRFTFRSQSALFDEDDVLLHAAEEGSGLRLWTARRNGPIATSAYAEWQ